MDVANASPINLRDRWRTADGLYLREAVLERIASGRSLAGLALGEIDGRIDLRGLSTAPSEALDLQSIPVIRSISISRVDLSHCSLPGWELRGVVVEHCRFVGASLRRWGLHGVRVSDCVFADTDLRELSTGASVLGRPTEIRTSRLEGADLRKAILVDTRIVESAFIDCNLRRVGFREVDLVRTIFAGKLEEVEFGKLLVRRGERLRDFSEVDLSKATLRWPTIASVSLRPVDCLRALAT